MTPDCTKCHRIVHLKMVSFLLCEWGWKSLSCIWLFVTPQTIQSMEFSRPEYWRGYLFPSLGDLPNPGIEPRSPALQVDSSPAEPQGKPKNTGVGSLSLLQQTFLTQKLNPGFLNSRQFFTNWALSYVNFTSIKKETKGASMVIQQLRICLAKQGMQVWSQVQEDPHDKEQLSPCDTAAEPVPQSPCLATWESTAARGPRKQQSRPCYPQIEKACAKQQRPSAAKK